MRRDMFRRKQSQAVQLTGAHPLGAKLDDGRRSQQSVDASVTTVSTSRGVHQGGSKFHDVKVNPARRSQSLEGNLDNIGVDHVIIRNEEKRKSLHSSHPHGLDVNNGNQQINRAVASLPVQGRSLKIIATPPSSSLLSPAPPPPAMSSSPTVDNVIKTDVELHVPYQPMQRISDAAKPSPFFNHKTQQPSGADVPHPNKSMAKGLTIQGEGAYERKNEETKVPLLGSPAGSGEKETGSEEIRSQLASQLPPKTNHPNPKIEDDGVFRVRTDTANSVMFDISYDL